MKFLCLFLLTLSLWAQPPGGPGRSGLFRNIRIQRIQQVLGFPEEKARSLADRWEAFDLEAIDKNRQINQTRKRFEAILMSPSSEAEKEAQLKPLLTQFLDLRRQQHEARNRFEEDLRTQLTTTQQVRFMLLAEEFRETLKENMRGMMRERGRPRDRREP